MWYGASLCPGAWVSARIVLITCASGSASSGESTTIERASCGFTISRSERSIGLPVRQTTRVLPSAGTFARIASSISTLSRSARITTTGSRSFAFATASSERIVKIVSAHPRISVWPLSTTKERPLRSSWSFVSSPDAITPINALTISTPPSVTRSITSRNGQPPPSPAIVPASSVCRRLLKNCLMIPGFPPPSASGASPPIRTTIEKSTIITPVATPSHAASAGVSLDIVLSNA